MPYLDIDIILSEEERLPCIFSLDARQLGALDPSNRGESDDLPAHSKIELPLWLAQEMAERHMVEVEIPKHFGSRMRDEIMAGPSSIKLKEFSFYFFEVGLKLCRITRDLDLRRTLRAAFCGDRYRELLVRALSK